MASNNYYEILGVSKDASQDDIKKAFKKASMKYHPDRLANKSESERKEGEEKFKQINEAYQTLSDPQKRQEYDNPNMGGFGGFGGFNPFGRGGGFSPFGHGFNPFGSEAREMREDGEDVNISVAITLEELFNGTEREIVYERNKRCKSCDGKGGDGKQVCPHCHGSGFITMRQQREGFMYQESRPCPHCSGTGYTVKNKCTSCGGSGYEKVSEKTKIKIRSGILNNERISLFGKGNEAKNSKWDDGNLNVFIQYKFDQQFKMMSDGTIYHRVDIPYYKCLLGCDIDVKLGNGKTRKIHIKPCTKPNDTILIGGEGVHFSNGLVGKYYILVNYDIPTSLSSEEEKALKSINKD